jgi:hypothetical protein
MSASLLFLEHVAEVWQEHEYSPRNLFEFLEVTDPEALPDEDEDEDLDA